MFLIRTRSQEAKTEQKIPKKSRKNETHPRSVVGLGAAPASHVAGNRGSGLWNVGVMERRRLQR